MSILDILYMVLTAPSQGLRIVVQRQPIGWAVLLAMFFSATSTTSVLPALYATLEELFGRPVAGSSLVLIFLSALASLVALFIMAGILHLIALLLGGRGNYRGLFCGLSFANLPSVFFAPLAFFSTLLGPFGLILYSLGYLALSTWILVLDIIALRYNYGFSVGKALLTYLIPVLAPLAILILLSLIIIALPGT